MAEIHQVLHAKLRGIEAERNRLQDRLAVLDQLMAAVRLLLEDEAPDQAAEQPHPVGRTPKSRFILTALGDGETRPLPELVRLAQEAHLDFEGKDPGRSLHFALVGLQRFGYANSPERGMWRLTERVLGERNGGVAAA